MSKEEATTNPTPKARPQDDDGIRLIVGRRANQLCKNENEEYQKNKLIIIWEVTI
jgi:hypothetical protein